MNSISKDTGFCGAQEMVGGHKPSPFSPRKGLEELSIPPQASAANHPRKIMRETDRERFSFNFRQTTPFFPSELLFLPTPPLGVFSDRIATG